MLEELKKRRSSIQNELDIIDEQIADQERVKTEAKILADKNERIERYEESIKCAKAHKQAAKEHIADATEKIEKLKNGISVEVTIMDMSNMTHPLEGIMDMIMKMRTE